MAIVEQERVRERERLAEPDSVLLRAAEIVRERWKSGVYGEPGGGRCALGALSEALGNKPAVETKQSLALYHSLGVTSIMGWNDTPGRTQTEVVEALERAAWGL